jgi:hypothetical protein
MNMLVENQGEMLKEIDMHAQDTVIHLEEGNKHVDRAITSAKATRKVKDIAELIMMGLQLLSHPPHLLEKMVLCYPGDHITHSSSILHLVVRIQGKCGWALWIMTIPGN